MITAKNLSDLIRKETASASADVNFDERYVFLKIRQHLNEQLKLEVYNRRNAFDKSFVAQYIATYPAVTLKDDGPLYKYIDLPEFYLSLPYNKGIYQICPDDDPHSPLIPRHFQGISKHLPCGDLQGKSGYWVEGLRVYFDADVNFSKAIPKLIVAAPDSIGPNDPLPITPEIQAEIVRRIKSEMLNVPAEDIISNQIDDRRSVR